MPDMPAARVTDPHVCPMSTGFVAHGGGPIMPPCEPTVETGNLKQARISDMATCVGPPDVIAQGSSTVTVRGLFAARMIDPTVHGGTILMGLFTVIIGGPVFTARPVTVDLFGNATYGSAIKVDADPDDPQYASLAIAALIRLDTTPTGSAIINALEASGETVDIEPYDGSAGTYNATTTENIFSKGSTIAWNPGVNGFGPVGSTADWEQPGSDIILGHEMVHAAHNATGTDADGPTVVWSEGKHFWNRDETSNMGEERNTTGLPAGTYNGPQNDSDGNPLNGTALPDTTGGAPGAPYTENKLRDDYRDRGIPSPVTGNPPDPRPSYVSGGGTPPF